MATNPKKVSRYLVATGLRLTDPTGSARFLEVVVCVARTGGGGAPEIGSTFLSGGSDLRAGGSACCRSCGKPHRIYSLVDAFQAGIAPLSRSGDSTGVSVETDDLIAAQLRWLREGEPKTTRMGLP